MKKIKSALKCILKKIETIIHKAYNRDFYGHL